MSRGLGLELSNVFRAFFIMFVLQTTLSADGGTVSLSKALQGDSGRKTGELTVYTIKTSCSALNGDCGSLTVTDDLPDGLIIKSCSVPTGYTATKCDEGGTSIQIDKDDTFNGGDTAEITIKTKVKLDATPGDILTNSATATYNSGDTITVNADKNVTVENKTQRWDVTKVRVSPSSDLKPTWDTNIVYEVSLCSKSAVGNVDLNGIEIKDVYPQNAQVVNAGDGSDDSSSHTLTWDAGDVKITDLYQDQPYKSRQCITKRYTLKYPHSDFDENDTIENNVTVTATDSNNDDYVGTAGISEQIGIPTPGVGLSKYADDVLQNENMIWTLNFNDYDSNAPVPDLVLYEQLPQVDGISVKSLTSGTWNSPETANGDSNVTAVISYATDHPGDCKNATYDNNITGEINPSESLTFSVDNSDFPANVTCFRWTFKDNGPDGTDIPMGWYNEIHPELELQNEYNGSLPKEIENCLIATYKNFDGSEGEDNYCNTANIEEPTPAINFVKTSSATEDGLKPYEEFEYYLTISQDQADSTGDIVNPVVTDLMPKEVEYLGFEVNGTEIQPREEVIDNYNNTGRKLVRFIWDSSTNNGNDVKFNEEQTVVIKVKARVKEGTAPGNYENNASIFDNSPRFNCVGDTNTTDVNDLDGDGNTDETICSTDNAIEVIRAAALKGEKWIRGIDDLGFVNTKDPSEANNEQCPNDDNFTKTPCVAQTQKGDNFEYKIKIKNVGNVKLKDYYFYDILPFVGDKGVSNALSKQDRGTKWDPTFVSIEAADDNTTNALNDGGVIEYSTSSNPCRGEIEDENAHDTGDWPEGCSNDWSATLPDNPGDVKAIRIKLPFNNTSWEPLEELQFKVVMKAPNDVAYSDITDANKLNPAWNSFAHVATGDDVNYTSKLQPAEPNRVGIVVPVGQKLSIGSLIWDDKNANGIQDSDEKPITEDVKVKLVDENCNAVKNYDNEVVAEQTVSNGVYNFGDLPDGNYSVVITEVPDGYIPTANQNGNDNDNNKSDSNIKDSRCGGYTSGVFKLKAGTEPTGEDENSDISSNGDDADDDNDSNGNMTIDFGFVKPACIGNKVWEDKNANGVQDSDESGVEGVKVQLLDENGDLVAGKEATSDADGNYQICGIYPGTYSVQVDKSTIPGGYIITEPKQGGDDETDSDINKTTGKAVKQTTLEGGDKDNTFDVGVYKSLCLGDYVWEDKNANGVQDAGESPINGVNAHLLMKDNGSWVAAKDTNGNLLEKVITEDGKYKFCNLKPGIDYKIKFDAPDGYMVTKKNSGGSAETDSDIDENSEIVVTDLTDTDLTEDAGYYKPACIGDRIWLDKNANGIQDAGEVNLNEQVKIELFDASGNSVKDSNGTVVAPIQTSNGNYKFCNLVPGDYKVKVTPPTGYFISPKDKTGNADDDNNNTNDDSDIDPSSGETVSVHLDSGEEDLTWDAGVFKPACIGDYIWEDKNANGLQEAGESGIAGATVTLLDKDGNAVTSNAKNQPIDPITTVANGKYEFCNLVPGKYMLEVTPPTDYLLTYQDKSGSSNDNGANNTNDDSDINITTHKSVVVELSSDENDTTWDAGVFKPACLGDYTWLDDNANGIQDDNKSLDGVNVTVLDKDGNPVTVGADGTTYSNTQVTGKVNGEPEGKYHFCNLRPGEYMVKFQKDPDSTGAPFISTDKDKGGDDNKDSDIPKFQDAKNGLVSDKVVLESGDDNRSIDAGFVQELCLGDYVWEDTNANGIQENGEPALANVPVKLMMDNGNGWEDAKDVKGNPVDANQTDENGKYKFCHLKPAIDYKIVFTKPTGYYVTDKDADNNSKDANDSDIAEDSTIVVKKPVRDDMSLDAGFFRPACIGDLVWEDKNGNGIQDADELGLDGVKVELLENNSTDITNVDGEKIGALITKDGGKYHFACKIKPGKYSLRFTTPDGYYFTKKDVASSTDSNDSDVEQFKAKVGTTKTTELTSGEDDLTWDAGVFKPACIGDYIWDDLNANGIQDEGEVAPMDDSNNTVPVNITLETIASGYDKDLDGNALNTTISDSGEYKFCKLVPGTYRVKVTVPANWYVTRRDKGDDDSKDSDMGAFLDTNKDVTMPSEELESGENNMTFDGGMFKPSCLGSTVWEDKNANGIKDDGEPGIKDVNVTLLPYEDDYGYENNMTVERQAFQTIQTDEDGKYQFCGLIPGKYRVMFEAPANADGTPRFTTGQNQGSDDKDSDAQEYKDGKVITAPVTVNSRANNQTVFAGYVKELCLGDYVWYDKNLNGTQDRNEPGVIGVNVHLTYADGTAVTDVNGDIVNVTQTNSKGKYSFCHLKPGKDYKIKFDVPESYHPTLQNRGGDTQDSDANENGVIVVKKAVKDDYSNDLGIYCDCDDYKVNPQNHKELKAPALGIFGLFIMIFTLFTIARKER